MLYGIIHKNAHGLSAFMRLVAIERDKRLCKRKHNKRGSQAPHEQHEQVAQARTRRIFFFQFF
jgi:hypothetical protein